MPLGVVLPKSADDVAAALAIARDSGVPVIARGGTSQNGQPIGPGLIVDCSKHFNGIKQVDRSTRTVVVEPGLVLEHLNARLLSEGLFFPVESTASRCTIGGMIRNNSCRARSCGTARWSTM